MNQSILFPDLQDYDGAIEGVRFPAQQAGALIECIVKVQWLASNVGYTLNSEDAILKAFSDLRFDIEEQVEVLIEDENFTSKGEIILD